MKVAVFIGSLRKDSYNRKVAKVVMSLAPKSIEMEVIEIGNLPMYNEDLDESPPETWVLFRQKVKSFDGVLFVTPEYNRSVPGVLKNAIDVGSRPYGKSIWSGKAGAVISASPGSQGAFGANHHLRQSFVFLDVPAMPQPEIYIGHVDGLFDDSGQMTNEKTKALLKKFIDSFGIWISKIKAAA